MSAETQRAGPVQRRAGLFVGFAAFAMALWVPDLPLDPLQRRVAAVTALTASLWITVAIPVGAASLIPAALFPILGVLPASAVAPVYMRDLVMLFIGAFIVALGLERWGVHRRMALWILTRVGCSPRRLVLGFMIASAFISMWINNTATTLLMLPIATAVVGKLSSDDEGETHGGKGGFGLCLLLGIAYCSSVGGMATPVGTAPNQEFLGQFADRFPEGPKLSFADWFLAFAPLPMLFVPLAWLLLSYVVFPLTGSTGNGAAVIERERELLGRASPPQRRMAAVFALTALLWVTRADIAIGEWRLPGWNRLFLGPQAADPSWYRAHKNDISDATVATTMALLCFLLPARDGRGSALMDWRTAAKLPWEVLLLLGGGFCLARGFNVSGLDRVLGESLSPLLQGHSSWIVVLAVGLLVSFLTEVTSNTATTAVLLPIVGAAAVAAGTHPLLVMLPTTLAASAAFMMPVATPPNAVVFSTRLVPMTAMLRAGVWLNLLMVGLITLVFQLWVRRFWGIETALPAWAGP